MTHPEKITKRNGRVVAFDQSRITDAILKAAESQGGSDRSTAEALSQKVADTLAESFQNTPPTIKDIQDTVERVLIDGGHASTAKAYILYRNKRDEMREKTKVRKTVKKKSSSTDSNLLVESDTHSEYTEWDKSAILDTLSKESEITPKEAREIASVVERRVLHSGVSRIGTALIRELINNELFERGKKVALSNQASYGISKVDLENLIFSKSMENSNITANNPEAINFSLTETILKKYALDCVFSPDVADAHKNALIHLHDLGHPQKYYCSGHSIEYIKKYGLQLSNLDTSSAPAKYARTLTGHINTFLASIQTYYAGALGLGAVNILYAPYLEGMSDKELLQEAQHLLFSCAQNAFSKGGQVSFSDHNVHIGVPPHLKDVPAIGSCGKYTGRTYGDYEETSNRFLMAMLRVWREGDMYGHLMSFPKMDIHVCEETFSNPKHKEIFMYACEIAAFNGLPYFVFDRDGVSISMCCRLKSKVAPEVLAHPERQMFCGFQNVTVNLPQCAYRAGKNNFKGLLKEVDKAIDLCIKAHLQKKAYVSSLMKAPNLPLWEMGKPSCNGSPYIDLDKATYIIGIIGLNECMQHILGKELHEGKSVVKSGLKVISHMYYTLKEYSVKHGLNFTLEESPAESASRRFARVDLKKFPESADYIKGDPKNDEGFYTNSIHLNAEVPVDIITRIKTQALFHNLIESGAIIHAFVGENRPNAESIAKLVELTYRKTNAAQITISPEFTICKKCHKMIPGMSVRCGGCGSENMSLVKRGPKEVQGEWSKENLDKLKGD